MKKNLWPDSATPVADRQPPVSATETPTEPDTRIGKDSGLVGRMTALQGQSERRRCRRCGGPVGGRRRNGYCSDKCRMQDRRARRHDHINELLSTIEAAVAAL